MLSLLRDESAELQVDNCDHLVFGGAALLFPRGTNGLQAFDGPPRRNARNFFTRKPLAETYVNVINREYIPSRVRSLANLERFAKDQDNNSSIIKSRQRDQRRDDSCDSESIQTSINHLGELFTGSN